MKRCVTCKVEQPLDEFNKKAGAKDGKQNACRECNRASSRAYYARNREKHGRVTRARTKQQIEANRRRVFDYLMANPCVDCGETHPAVLQFDHVRDKVKAIAACMDWGWTRLKAEIDKCEVRCANCHSLKTAKDFGWYSWRFYEELQVEMSEQPD